MKPTVLIATTCRWVPTARLAMALTNAGCLVEAVCPSQHPVEKTGAIRRVYEYRSLTPTKSFAAAIEAAGPEVVIPGDDLATQHLHDLYQQESQNGQTGAKIRALLERSLGAPEHFAVLYQRCKVMEIAEEEGIRVPPTAVVANNGDLRKWIKRNGFPIVLKANETSGGDGVKVVHSFDEAETALQKLQAPPLMARAVKRALIDSDRTLIRPSFLRRKHVVNAQTFVAGREATTAVACWKGKVLASLHFEVLNKSDASGPATVIRRIENAEMADAAEKLVCRLNLSGIHGFDFMLETQTGRAYLIEINPRATQVGHLTFGVGHDIPAAMFAAISGEKIQVAPKLTESDTIALFPQEWKRDPESKFLRSAFHDVPWEEPALVHSCISKTPHGRLRKSKQETLKSFATGRSQVNRATTVKPQAVGLDCELK